MSFNFSKCFNLLPLCKKLNNSGLIFYGVEYSTINVKKIKNIKSIRNVYHYWKNKFFECKIIEPHNSIMYILSQVYDIKNISGVYKIFNKPVSRNKIVKIQKMCELRLKSMPIQYILGEWNFCGLDLKMKPPVFIPRPETEILVNIIQDYLNENTNITNLLEICCGSGAISLSLLKFNNKIKITAIDKNPAACILTSENAKLHNLENRLIVINYEVNDKKMLNELNATFDMIISNPPYVLSADVETVQPEIKLYEDLSALDGGYDGLSVIKSILLIASCKLISGGRLFLETDSSHPPLIQNYVNENKFLKLKFVCSYKDFCNKDRFVVLTKL